MPLPTNTNVLDKDDLFAITNPSGPAKERLMQGSLKSIPKMESSGIITVQYVATVNSGSSSFSVPVKEFGFEDLYQDANSRTIDFINLIGQIANTWRDIGLYDEGSDEWEETSTIALNKTKTLSDMFGISSLHDEIISTLTILVRSEAKQSLTREKQKIMTEVLSELGNLFNVDANSWDVLVEKLEDGHFDINILMPGSAIPEP